MSVENPEPTNPEQREEQREEQASLYALDLLEGDELAAFERAMKRDPALETLTRELAEASTVLAASLPQQSAPAALKDTILRNIPRNAVAPVREAREGISFGWVPWAIAAGLALYCGLLWQGRSELSTRVASLIEENSGLQRRVVTLDEERSRLESRVSALESEKNDLKVRVASLENRDALQEIRGVTLSPQPGVPPGEASALWDQNRQTGVVDIAKLPPLPADKNYQLWIISPDSPQPISAGVLAGTGPRLPFRAPQPVREVAALAISLEPRGGSLTPTTVVYVGKL